MLTLQKIKIERKARQLAKKNQLVVEAIGKHHAGPAKDWSTLGLGEETLNSGPGWKVTKPALSVLAPGHEYELEQSLTKLPRGYKLLEEVFKKETQDETNKNQNYKNRILRYLVPATAVLAIGLGVYVNSNKTTTTSQQSVPRHIENKAGYTAPSANVPKYTEPEFLVAARKYGLTGIYAIETGKKLSEIKPKDYSVGGPIDKLAASVGVNLFDESNEPKSLKKNGLNNLLTIAQAKRLYEKASR